MRQRDEELHQALVDGDDDRVAEAARKGADPFSINALGLTAQELAALLHRHKSLAPVKLSLPTPLLLQGPKDDKPQSLPRQEMEEKLHFHLWPWLFFDSWEALMDVYRRCPMWLGRWALGRHHRWLGAIHSRQLISGDTPKLSVRWVSKKIGYGLFAEEYLPKGTYIGQYGGQVRKREKTNAYCLHYPTKWLLPGRYMVDARDSGGLMRFINHSDTPNLQPQIAVRHHFIHTIFETSENVEKGGELTFDYGKYFWCKAPDGRQKH